MAISRNEKNDIDDIFVKVDMGKVKLELRGKSLLLGFKFGNDGLYFRSKYNPSKVSGACVTVPYFKGTTKLTIGNNLYEMLCIGHHDHLFGTVDITDTHQKWYWFRAVDEKHVIVSSNVTPHSEYYGNVKYLFVGNQNTGEVFMDNTFSISSYNLAYENKIKLLKFPHKLHICKQGKNIIILMLLLI